MAVPTGPFPVIEEKRLRPLGASPDSSKKEMTLDLPWIVPKSVSIHDLSLPLHPEWRRGFLVYTKYPVAFYVVHDVTLPARPDEI